MSASSLKTFQSCPQMWYFAYIERRVSPPSVKQQLGVAAHRAVEVNYDQKRTSKVDLPENDVLDAFSSTYDMAVEEVEQPDEDVGKAKDQGVGLVRLHHREIAPTIQPVWVEEPIQYRLITEHEMACKRDESCACGIPFTGTVDLADSEGRVRDLKTTKKKPAYGAHLMQVTGYALAYRHRTGQKESDVVIDYLVRTKVPAAYAEAWGSPVDDHGVKVFARQVDNAVKMINAGIFPATGVTQTVPPCSWCGYRNICPAWKGRVSK